MILAREAIASVAAKHGLVASFLPKLDAAQAGSGQHLHISLWKVIGATSFWESWRANVARGNSG